MNIYYFSAYDILRLRTNQIGDVRLCEGFAENNCYVELIVPFVYRKDNIRRDEIFHYYGVKTKFRIKILKTLLLDNFPKTIRLSFIYIFGCFVYLRIFLKNMSNLEDVVIMSRNVGLLIPPILFKKIFRLKSGPKVIAWVHEAPTKKNYVWVYKKSDGVVGTNSAITRDIKEKFHLSDKKFAVSLNPISEAQLKNKIDKSDARDRVGINCKEPLVVYTGKLYIGQKEAEYILDAAKYLHQYSFLFTGGKPNVIQYYREWCRNEKMENVSFTGFIHKYDDIRFYQYSADVLVSYYSVQDHQVRYNLPNKICEYMLTGNPIVTSNFPAVKDILNSKNAIFVEPEDPKALSEGIAYAIECKDGSSRLAENALIDVKQITFKKRTKRLIEFFHTLTNTAGLDEPVE